MAARPTRGNQVDKYFATKRYARFVEYKLVDKWNSAHVTISSITSAA